MAGAARFPRPDPQDRATQARLGTEGFTLIELVIAVVILAVGALGYAGTNAYLVRQTTVADLQTERTTALISALERVNSLPYDSVVPGSDSIGRFTVDWSVTTPFPASKLVTFVTTGPGLTSRGADMPTIQANVADTFTYSVLEP